MVPSATAGRQASVREPLIDPLLLSSGCDRLECTYHQECPPLLNLQTAEEACDYEVQFLVKFWLRMSNPDLIAQPLADT